MAATFDPNAPDCSNGDFFCKLCLASMNSEQMWSSHIVGKRHIKNVQKYPNGLPKRFDDEDSFHRWEDENYEDDDNYPPTRYDDYYYHDEDYYDKNPVDYVPAVRPNVVIDYGHSKKLDEILPQDSKIPEAGAKINFPAPKCDTKGLDLCRVTGNTGDLKMHLQKNYPLLIDKLDNSIKQKVAKVIPQGGRSLNVDDILDEIKSEKQLKSSGGVVPKKDDFFEKINQRELARDLALEHSKRTIKRKQDEEHNDEKRSKHGSFPNTIDRIHEYNDDDLYKKSKIEKCEDSSSSKVSSMKLEVKLNEIDPDKLTPDILDDLLSSHLTSKINSPSKEIAKSPKEKIDIDDPKVIAEKLNTLPNKIFFKIVHDKLKKMELKDSEEFKMLLKVMFEAQEILCKKLPTHVQSAIKEKVSENNSEKGKNDAQKTAVLQSHSIASVTTHISSTGMTESIPATSSQTKTTVSQNYTVPLVSSLVQNTADLQNFHAIPIVPHLPSPVPASGPAVALVQNTAGLQNYPSALTVPQLSSPIPASGPAIPIVQNTAGLQNYPAIPPVPQFSSPVLAPSSAGSVPSKSVVYSPIQSFPGRFPVVGASLPPNPTALQNSQANSALYYQMLSAMYQISQPVPSTVANSVPSTLPSLTPNSQLPTTVQSNPSPSNDVAAAIKQIQMLSEQYKSKNESSKEKYKKESKVEANEKYKNYSKHSLVPSIGTNSVPNTLLSQTRNLLQSTAVQSNLPHPKDFAEALKRVQMLAEQYKKDNEKYKYRKGTKEESIEKSKNESKYSVVPSTNANSATCTLPLPTSSMPQPKVLQSNPPSSGDFAAALKRAQMLAEQYKANEKYRKETKEESNDKNKNESKYSRKLR